MLPIPDNYAIYPSVLPIGRQMEMIIAPLERAFLFADGEELTITAVQTNGNEDNYETLLSHKSFPVTAKDGVIRFPYTYEEEGQYLFWLIREEKKIAELFVYALEADLYALTPLKGDFHSHSVRSDGKRDPAALAGHFREQGYDFFALTDHNRYYPGSEVDEAYAGVKLGITRIRGEEVHAPESNVHIVHVGGKSSVADLYFHHQEEYAAEIAEYESRVPEEIPEMYRYRYARAMWATDRIHEAGGLAIFAHPYWQPKNVRVHNVRDQLAKMFLTSGMFDVYELVGAMGQVGINRSINLWADLRSEGLKISIVGSSDAHGLEKSATFSHTFTVCFAEKNENDAIIDAVRAGRTVAVEAAGEGYDRHYRCYGNLRLVSYVHFLLQHYFPKRQRICQGEGTAMRAYLMGEVDAAMLEAQVAYSSDWRDRFLGKKPPVLPSAAIRDFEARALAVHATGPVTKGSRIKPKVAPEKK